MNRFRTTFIAATLFLSGFMTAAPASAASLTVTSGAATVGSMGLEVAVGGSCSSPDNLTLPPPAGPLQGTYEACISLNAENVVIGAAGATFRAGQLIALGEGFSVPPGVSFSAEINPSLAHFASVDDPSPIDETVYNARFYLRLDSLALTTGDAIEHLVAYSAAGESQFLLTLRKNPIGQSSLHLAARQDGGGLVQMTPGQELPLSTGWNKIDVEWSAKPGTGAFLVAVNDGTPSGLTNLSNAAARVETIRWGAIGGSVSTTNGVIELDGFDSWR